MDFDIPALNDYDTLTAMHNKATTAATRGGGGDRLRLPSIDRPANRRESRERQHLMHVDAQIAEQKEQTTLSHNTPSDSGRWTAATPSSKWQQASQAGASASSSHLNQSAHSSSSVNVYKHFCPVQRAPTPSLPSSQADTDGLTVAVTLLQRLIRGRAQQNSLISEAARRQHLIREMVQVAAQQGSRHKEDGADEESTPVIHIGLSSAVTPAASVSSSSSSVSLSPHLMFDVLLGSLVSDDLSSLIASRHQSSALLALSSYMQQALFVRRVRESEEAGRRQAQEELRQCQDEHYTNTQRSLRQHTAAHHTNDIVQRAIAAFVQQNQSQSQQASVAIQSDGSCEVDDDVVIAELLQSVVWPEVEQRITHDSVVNRRFLDAAHHTALSAICEQVQFNL